MLRQRCAVPLVVVLAFGLAACGATTRTTAAVSARPTALYTVSVTGAAESPPGAPHGRGVAIVAFHGPTEVCFRFAHLHGFSDATTADIEAGASGRTGSPVIALGSGPKLHHRGCRSVTPALSKTIWQRPASFDVVIHSRRYPAGAVAGRL